MPELFQTYDEEGGVLELVERSQVHRLGLWHRSSVVYLFHPGGRLYVQRRAACKDLYEDLLDHSVGEHLTPGETHVEAAHRGLSEELGLTGIDLQALGGERHLRNAIPEQGIRDNEFQQVFKGVYEGKMRLDPEEVSEVRLFSIAQLSFLIKQQPEIFTPWFASDLVEFGFLPLTHDLK
jgi:isopentenyl-diphosphate Delta-isomerase